MESFTSHRVAPGLKANYTAFCKGVSLSTAEAPAGYPYKIAIIEKIKSIVPRALSCSFSPASPQHKEASAEEREWVLQHAHSVQLIHYRDES